MSTDTVNIVNNNTVFKFNAVMLLAVCFVQFWCNERTRTANWLLLSLVMVIVYC